MGPALISSYKAKCTEVLDRLLVVICRVEHHCSSNTHSSSSSTLNITNTRNNSNNIKDTHNICIIYRNKVFASMIYSRD